LFSHGEHYKSEAWQRRKNERRRCPTGDVAEGSEEIPELAAKERKERKELGKIQQKSFLSLRSLRSFAASSSGLGLYAWLS
jgi:hypothetical protein